MNEPVSHQFVLPVQHGSHSSLQSTFHNHPTMSTSSHLPSSSRIPDSPPITDLGIDTGSPSSSSARSLYSPDYGNFSAIDNNNGGFVLAVNDLVCEQDERMTYQQQMQLPSYMHSPYQPQPIQLSPPEITQYGQQMPKGSYGNTYTEPSKARRMSGAPSMKRARTEYQQQPTFDLSRVKPDPSMLKLSYPKQSISRFVPPNTAGNIAESPMGSDVYSEDDFGGVNARPRVITFAPFYEETWLQLYDEHHQPLRFHMQVITDKGFKYSAKEGVFVNQKKNHFQVTVNIEALDGTQPVYILVNGEFVPLRDMKLTFCGVKSEEHSSEIKITQSDTQRRTANTEPVKLNQIPPRKSTEITVQRLHFDKCTDNNQLKNGKISQDQKFFLLVAKLMAFTEHGSSHTILAYNSEPFVVRAGNPKAFETPTQSGWESDNNFMYSLLPISIGINRNLGGMLNVSGDIILTGRMQQYSDGRLKINVKTLDVKKALKNHSELRIVEYEYKPEVAQALGMTEESRHRYGVVAQEVANVHPESVHQNGEFLTVDENRMFYENIVVTQHLSKMQVTLDEKIDERASYMQTMFRKIFRPKDAVSVTSADSGIADQQSLSTSRLTLASAFTREIAKHHKHEACHNPSCSHFEGSSQCTSKLTQGTIITLVVVMAVCLLSMSGLYVFDWHHRNYGINAIERRNTTDESVKTGDDLGMMKKTIIMPRNQPGAPPLHDMCLHAGCRSFCCEKKATYETESRQGGFNVDTVKPLSGSRKNFLAAIAGSEMMNPTAFFAKPLSSGARFEIEGRNMTIDSRYCTERSCNEKKGRYHLFVPISPYMPTTPVLLRITPPPGMFVQSCGHMLDFQEEECSSEGGSPHFTLSMPTAIEVARDLFEISAGNYKRSGYRFRVGTNTESCYGSEERFKSSYEEYNIIFYRTCGGDSEQAPTTIEIENERDFGMPFRDSRPNVTVA